MENEKIIKNREYKYDTMKFILIFLVVFGHIIEYKPSLNMLYLLIYSFHMPLFIFVSGYFSKGNIKSIVKPVCFYIVFQTIYFLIEVYILKGNIKLNYFKPIWIMWYLFSLFTWNLIIMLIKKTNINNKKYCYMLIIFAVIVALIAGYVNRIGYKYSLSRTITFFPYFLLGFFTKNNNIKLVQKENKKKVVAYCIIAVICAVYYICMPTIGRRGFYGSYSYKSGEYNIYFKMISYLTSLIFIYLFNNYTPNKKTIISSMGKYTLYVYLIHGMIIECFRENFNIVLKNHKPITNIGIAIVLSLVMIVRHRRSSITYRQDC